MEKKKIAVIGGGTGSYTVLKGLKKYDIGLSAIVSMFDSGGSTGVLRDELGALPPGDLRRCLIALADEDNGNNVMRELFQYRFEGGVGNHSLGNLILTAAEKRYGDIALGIGKLSKILKLRGKAYPVSLDDCTLCAKLKDDLVIEGETKIDILEGERAAIDSVFLEPEAEIYGKARKAIFDSDLVVIGPGDLYTSIIPNLLVNGVPEAIRGSRGKVVYVCNLMTKHGETDDYKASDFLKEIERYLGGEVDYVLCNREIRSGKLLETYREEKQFPVEMDLVDLVQGEETREGRGRKLILADMVYEPDLIRHHRDKLARELMTLIDEI